MNVTYRLLSLEFRNGRPDNERRLGFANATLRQDPARRVCTVAHVGMLPAERRKFLELGTWFYPYELESIRYELRAGANEPIFFKHPFPRGAGVFLREFPAASPLHRDNLFLQREGDRLFFSNDFTLADVSKGAINSQQKVYQFHE